VEDATIALAEALNNIEEHAYSGRPDLPVLVVSTRGHCVNAKSKTAGTPARRIASGGAACPRRIPVAHDEWPEGGFGWALLRRLTSDLAYQRRGEDRNRLRFTIS
jgi:serine/threonine-protein kinase RsbW